MTRYSKSIGTFLGTLLLAAGLTLGLGAPPALGGDVDVGPVDLPPGETLTIIFDTVIDDPLTPPTETPLCNQGTVSFTGFSDVDTDDPDVVSSANPTCTDIVFNGDLVISKTSPDPVLTGASFDYTITVTNNGPDAIPDVIVEDTVPAGFTSISTTDCDNDGSSVAGQVVTCELGTLIDDEVAVFTISVTAPGSPEADVSNTATILTANSNTGNDSSEVTIQVVSTVTLTVVVDAGGTGAGTVTAPAGPDPTMGGTGINCGSGGSNCTEDYNPAVVVPLLATADAGSFFNGWTDCDSGAVANPCNETMDGAESVTATFDDLPTLTVTGITGNGDVDSSVVTTIACSGPGTSGTCTGDFAAGSTVILTADPDTGWRFGSWSGDCSGELTNACTFSPLNADQDVSVTFLEVFDVTVTAITGNGDVDSTATTSAVGNIDCDESTPPPTGTCTDEFDKNSNVTLTATADPGFIFVSWGGACSTELTNVCTLSSITGNQNVSVTFIQQFTLTVQVPGAGNNGEGGVTDLTVIDCNTTGTMICTQDFDTGTTASLAAAAVAGSVFSGWSDAPCDVSGGGTDLNCQITMNADKTVTANFLTPEEGIDMLIQQVLDMGLQRGIEKALMKQLEDALNLLAMNKPLSAAEKVAAFLHTVDAQDGKKLTPGQAAELRAKGLRVATALIESAP